MNYAIELGFEIPLLYCFLLSLMRGVDIRFRVMI